MKKLTKTVYVQSIEMLDDLQEASKKAYEVFIKLAEEELTKFDPDYSGKKSIPSTPDSSNYGWTFSWKSRKVAVGISLFAKTEEGSDKAIPKEHLEIGDKILDLYTDWQDISSKINFVAGQLDKRLEQSLGRYATPLQAAKYFHVLMSEPETDNKEDEAAE